MRNDFPAFQFVKVDRAQRRFVELIRSAAEQIEFANEYHPNG
jgi:hypothetical protein